jgi:hypothetical protein
MHGTQGSSPTTRRRLLALGGLALGTGLAGCSTTRPPTDEPTREATLTVSLTNRDAVPREFEVVARQGTSVTDRFSGTLPADPDQPVVMVATFRVTDDQYQFSINTAGGQRGRTWDPADCDALRVDAAVEDGEPTFESSCQSEQ